MARRASLGRCRLALVLAPMLVAAAASAATIQIVNRDGAGVGLNDPTPAAPIGGNPGTTLGEQRLNVVQTAASIWGGILPSTVPIRVEVSFAALKCSASTGTLASAGPNFLFWDFANAPFAGTLFGKAQADKLADRDLSPGDHDIGAHFNSAIGTPGCLASSSWYYGLDHNEGASQFDMLAVALHEFAHGLGFLTFIDDSTGALAYGMPDVYSRFILDTDTGLHWSEETDAQRAASDTATFRVLWDGAATREQARTLLAGRPLLRVNAPAAIAGDVAVGLATFGAPLSNPGVTGDVVLADDGAAPVADGCTALVNAAQVAGRIALVDRGGCSFALKVKLCQDAGAVGVIVADNVASSVPGGMSGTDASITIPSVRITLADGDAIKAQLGAGVNVTLRTDPAQYAGADATGRLMLYAPNPNVPGSSISHWDVSATPNLLMEPNLNPDETSDVDLTRYAFEDMGWFIPVEASLRTLVFSAATPNPFQSTTTFELWLPVAGEVDLAVFDIAGRRVRGLIKGHLDAGTHRTQWDGLDDSGNRAHAGLYFSHLVMEGVERSHKMVVLP